MPTTIASLLIKVGVQFKDVKKGFKQVESSMGKFSNKIKNLGTTAQIALGNVLGNLATNTLSFVGDQFKDAIKLASEFQSELAQLSRVSGISGKELERLGDDARRLSSELGISAKDVAHGLADFAKLGYDAKDSLEALTPVLKLAKVKSLDFGKTLRTVESAISVFKLGVKGAKKTTDTFLYTMDHSLATIDDLKESFKYAAPAAKAAGASVEELSAAIAILANNGTTGSTAGTTLRRAFERLASSTPKVVNTLRDLKVSVTDANGNFKPFTTIVNDLTAAFAKLDPKQKIAYAQLLFGTSAASGMLKILSQAPGKFEEFAKAADAAGGAVDKSFTKQQQTFEATWERFKTTADNFKIAIGNAVLPPLKAALELATDVVQGPDLKLAAQKWSELGSSIKRNFTAGVAAVKAKLNELGSYFTSFISKAVNWGANLARGFASGIKSAWNSVKSAVSSGASIVAKYLRISSPSELGPLSDSDKWMPNFMNMLAKGIELGIPKVQMAVGDVASSLEVVEAGQLSRTNNFNIYPKQATLDSKGLNREMERMRWLNGGAF